MSLASMVDTKLALQKTQDPLSTGSQGAAGIGTNLLNQITQWIPH
jgi:hypothetical protein